MDKYFEILGNDKGYDGKGAFNTDDLAKTEKFYKWYSLFKEMVVYSEK